MDKSESQKFTHDEVGYEFPSTHPGERCSKCEHFIPAKTDAPAGCEGVQRPIQIQAWCHRFKMEKQMAEQKKHAGHGIKSTHIHHHHDGSHTMEQHHEDGSMTSSAKGDLDQVHDHLENTIGTPNEGEQAPPVAAAPAAAPMPAAGM